MKWVYRILYLIGFALEVVVPICLFGAVTPLVHTETKDSLTAVGLIVAAVFVCILLGKIKGAVKEWKKGVLRALLLALIKAVPVAVLCVAMYYVIPILVRFTEYTWRIAPIFAIGLGFDVAAEVIESRVNKS